MILDGLFNRGKKKEQLLQERQSALDDNWQKTTKVQETNAEVQKGTMEVAWKNQELNEKLTQLVIDNEKTRNILLERENKIQTTLDDLEERKKEVRKDEIEIIARKADVRKNEQQTDAKKKQLDAEEKSVKQRETEAEKVKSESESAKEKYQTLFDELEGDKEKIKELEEEANQLNQDAKEKNTTATETFERAQVIDEEIKNKEAKFEEHREKIETALNEKIAEYDRRLEDLDSVKGIVDDVKFDKSQEGKEAKIVVKEAIRQAKKTLTDAKSKFEELDEKYSSGTFKGFSTPLTEIDKSFEDLKTQYEQIKEHISKNDELPVSVSKWLDSIEESIVKADESRKSWEFSKAYRHIVFGLSTCKNYELLLSVLNEWAEGGAEETDVEEEDEFIDWYEILEVKPVATQQEIKKQYRELMKKHHPDKNGSEESTAKTALINQAYKVLGDKQLRKEFDEQRKKHKQKATS